MQDSCVGPCLDPQSSLASTLGVAAGIMPIYCLNGTQTARKRSQNIMHELVGANNYYMNNSQQLSMASYHILVNKNKSLSSSSLMMVINRFKTSVKNMKDSVLIPTRLSDLVCPDEDATLDEQSESVTGDSGGERTDTWCRALSPAGTRSHHSSAPVVECATTMASIKLHNLYEQYKLLNLIDKILSSDATLTVSSQRQCSRSRAIVLSAFENDDNNNSNSKQTNGQEESVKFNNSHQNGESDAHAKRLSTGKTLSQQTRPGATAITDSAAHGESACPGGDLVTDCSLLKIKDKLEYHLVSLKNILSLMSSSADYITQKYLEDIQCEDRFDKQAKSCDQHDSIRHYYTSNNNAPNTPL